MYQKECYTHDRHLLHGYWQKGPLRQPSIQDDVAPITPPGGGGGRDNSRQSLRRRLRNEHMRSGACMYTFSYPPFIRTTQSSVLPYGLYARMHLCELTKRITHRLLVDTFSCKGKHICTLSKHHAVKMAYMDNWRSAPSNLVPDAA